MFGGENNHDDGLALGAAVGMALRLRNAEIDHADEIAHLSAGNAQALENYQSVIYALEDNLADARRELAEAKRALAESERTIAAERCEIAGLTAFIGKIRTLDRTTPGLAASGHFYQSGNSKAVATLDYERAYDAKAIDLGFASLRGTYAK